MNREGLRRSGGVLGLFLSVFLWGGMVQGQVVTPCPPGQLPPAEFFVSGENAHDNFGISVARAGDVDGDGWEDLLVGAPFVDAGEKNGGAAYLFQGGTTPSNTYTFRLLAETANDQLGYSVSGIGDINGDGYADVAVGARYNDRAHVNAGAVWVVYGDSSNYGDDFVVVTGQTSGAAGFGHAVAGGDFNGDGFDDLAVGAPFDGEGPSAQRGKVQLFFGGTNGLDIHNPVTMLGEGSGQQFGWAVANAGDLNDNGKDDLVVGARWYGAFPDSGIGRAYIYFGGNPMSTNAGLVLTGEHADDWLGYSVAGVGDINGDGYADVAAGAPLFSSGNATGRVYVLFGGDPMNNVPDLIFNGVQQDDQFGWSVGGGVDLDQDGYSDIIVGARFDNCATNASGAAYIFYGGDPPNAMADISVASLYADDALGTSVGMIGQWGGLGPAAMAGAPWNDLVAEAAGAVSIFSLPPLAFHSIESPAPSTIQISLPSQSGLVYRIEFIDAIDDDGVYQSFANSGTATATASVISFIDDFATNSSGYPPGTDTRFYRAFRR